MAEYYLIKPSKKQKKSSNEDWIVIKLKKKSGILEVLAGEGSLEDYGAEVKGSQILVKRGYTAIPLKKEEAQKRQDEYLKAYWGDILGN